jgi:hypothetical protein
MEIQVCDTFPFVRTEQQRGLKMYSGVFWVYLLLLQCDTRWVSQPFKGTQRLVVQRKSETRDLPGKASNCHAVCLSRRIAFFFAKVSRLLFPASSHYERQHVLAGCVFS